jgi:hypothetical protein
MLAGGAIVLAAMAIQTRGGGEAGRRAGALNFRRL